MAAAHPPALSCALLLPRPRPQHYSTGERPCAGSTAAPAGPVARHHCRRSPVSAAPAVTAGEQGMLAAARHLQQHAFAAARHESLQACPAGSMAPWSTPGRQVPGRQRGKRVQQAPHVHTSQQGSPNQASITHQVICRPAGHCSKPPRRA